MAVGIPMGPKTVELFRSQPRLGPSDVLQATATEGQGDQVPCEGDRGSDAKSKPIEM